jgi:hypothetical protein
VKHCLGFLITEEAWFFSFGINTEQGEENKRLITGVRSENHLRTPVMEGRVFFILAGRLKDDWDEKLWGKGSKDRQHLHGKATVQIILEIASPHGARCMRSHSMVSYFARTIRSHNSLARDEIKKIQGRLASRPGIVSSLVFI